MSEQSMHKVACLNVHVQSNIISKYIDYVVHSNDMSSYSYIGCKHVCPFLYIIINMVYTEKGNNIIVHLTLS